MVLFLLLVNTSIGTAWFMELTDLPPRKKFDFNDGYAAYGLLMILIPWSLFCLLTIVLVKVLCIYIAENRNSRSRRRT